MTTKVLKWVNIGWTKRFQTFLNSLVSTFFENEMIPACTCLFKFNNGSNRAMCGSVESKR